MDKIRPLHPYLAGILGLFLTQSLVGGCLWNPGPESDGQAAPVAAAEARTPSQRPRSSAETALMDTAIPDGIHQLLLPPVDSAARAGPRDQTNTPGMIRQTSKGSSGSLLDIIVDDTPARTFFLGLADESKLNLIVHPQVRGNISLTMHRATVHQVVQTVCRMYDYDCESTANGYFIGPTRLLTRQYHVNYLQVQRRGVTSTQISSGRTKTSSNTMANATGNQTSSQSFHTSGSQVTTDQNASFWDEFTYSLCGILGLGFFPPETKSSSLLSGASGAAGSGITPQSSANQSIAGIPLPAGMTAPGTTGPALPTPAATPKNTISQTLLSWNPRDTDRMVTGCAEQDESGNTQTGRRVVISPQTGNVIVRAYPSELREIEYFLEQQKQDIQRQVILEAKILEVELGNGFQSGINWGMILGHHKDQINTMNLGGGGSMLGDQTSNPLFTPNSSLGFSPSNLVATQAANGTALSTNTNNILFGGAFATSIKVSDFSALIELLDVQGRVHVLSSPRIATLNNQKAVIRVGQDEQFVTDVHSETSTTTVTLVPEFTTFFSGIALDVTPQISQNYGIMLHIHPTVSEVTTDEKQITLGTSTQTYPMALNRVRESDSMVQAANGEVVVIGGLMKDFSTRRKAGVPFLKDLPVVGDLFGSQETVDKKTELVILMRPVIVEPGNQAW
ncbi:MAG: secretin N-terminal domain-containing protein, partial [Magnetococcales bacterium]|nr:secretin N-terminal domain-containing protein [Magnetococcales bacterium]